MKKILFFIMLFSAFVQTVRAEDINIADFYLDEHDLTALQPGTMELDQNGDKCALLKIATTETGFTFDVGSLGVKKTVNKVGEIWVYVPYGVKWLVIGHPKLGRSEKYFFPVSIEKGRTYKMKITSKKIKIIYEEEVTSQYVIFNVTPSDALVEFNGELLEVLDGTASKYVAFGTYDYNVQAKDYHSEAGKVTVSDSENQHIVNVNLKPAFGWVEVSGNASLNGAVVYIDNELIGKVPVKSERLSSGKHTLKIVRSLYNPYVEEITVSDNQTLTLSPSLSADFSNVTLTVGKNAEIWVNGEKKGNGSWTGPLKSGDYLFETKLQIHRTSSMRFSVSSAQSSQAVTLPDPIPIHGKINISTSPAMCDVYLDDNLAGKTPIMLTDVLIGSHDILISKSGYGDYRSTVSVTEGQTANVNVRLSNATDVTLKFSPSNAKIMIDGATYNGAQTASLSYGSHTITMQAEGYKDFSATINVTETNKSFSLAMEALFGPKTFTVKGVSFTMIPVQGGTFQMGATPEQEKPSDSEKPVHSVTLSSYYIGETEVTQELWEAVMGSNPSRFYGSSNPVEQVTWNNCQKFIKKLNSLTGQRFRLPTEAEWEFAARGGSKSRGYQYSGSNTIGDVAWYYSKSSIQTHPVKTKQPNELGIYDMSGNVYEWCQDWYGNYSSSSQTNPTGPTSGYGRVIRGGSWGDFARSCRVAFRNCNTPGDTYYGLGLRLALSE